MDNTTIVIRGAREHNLRNVNLELPRNQLIVFTGVSGSGKSSLAFDTLYAEGQRRYVESLSSYARQFLGHCPQCGRPITAQTREQILARILALAEGTRFLVLAPVIRGQKGEYKDLFADMLRRGFVRARVDGKVVRLSDDLQLDRRIKHNIEIVIDRLKVDSGVRTRLAEAVEQALNLSEGALIVAFGPGGSRERQRPEKAPVAAAPGSPDYEDLLLSAHY